MGAETRAEQVGCDGEDVVASVGACIASAGSLQRAFERVRGEFPVVKVEPAVDGGRAQESAQDKDCHSGQQAWPQMWLLRLSELKYTQKSINCVFRDGSTLESLLRDLHSRKVDPIKHANMVLEVVKVDGTYYSNDNRRLKVLREYQHDLGRELYVQCRVFEWHRAYGRWLDRYIERRDARLGDEDGIQVRTKRRLEPTPPDVPPPPHLRKPFIMSKAAEFQ